MMRMGHSSSGRAGFESAGPPVGAPPQKAGDSLPAVVVDPRGETTVVVVSAKSMIRMAHRSSAREGFAPIEPPPVQATDAIKHTHPAK